VTNVTFFGMGIGGHYAAPGLLRAVRHPPAALAARDRSSCVRVPRR
jgi:hypothetical protein